MHLRALGAFSTGVGSTDLAGVFASANAGLRIPELSRPTDRNAPNGFGKDVVLHLI
jgi:3-isopropylmalate/(R)-2-methylmalate dehydratase large subunit